MSTVAIQPSASEMMAADDGGLHVGPIVAPALDAAALEFSYEYCHTVTKKRARNFYYGLRVTPEPKRSAIYAMYAWMRAGDDAADEPPTEQARREGFAEFRRTSIRVLAGDWSGVPHDTFWPAFVATVSNYGIDRHVIDEMMAGLEEDLDHQRYPTAVEFDQYCYRVGSTVGIACVAIWGLKPGADRALARAKAEARGKAFQMTNILRDVAQDYDAADQRVYLPMDAIERHGLTPERLRKWACDTACEALMLEQIKRARGFYRASQGLEDMIDPACRGALWGMTTIYRALLERIADKPKRVFGGSRVRLSSLRKATIALRALIMSKWTRPAAANEQTTGDEGSLASSAGQR